MSFVENDNVIQALSANRSNQALNVISSSTADASFCELDANAMVLASEMHHVSHHAL